MDWSAERVQAFEDAKAALASAAMLAHPSPAALMALTTDASEYVVGALCEQWVAGAWQPLASFSRKLQDNERKYSTFDRKLFLSTRHFRFLLEGREFTFFVDHKPLTFALAKTTEPWSARQQHQLSVISEFTTDIRQVAGKDNLVADCLSQAHINSVHLGVDYAAMAADQLLDSDIQGFRTATTGLRLEDVEFHDSRSTLLCDVSTGWHRRVFDAIHSVSHPGVKASVKLVGAKFVWPQEGCQEVGSLLCGMPACQNTLSY